MKRFIALALSALMVLSLCSMFAACNKNGGFKVGVILVGDENEGYTKAHMDGINAAAKACGLKDDQIIWKKSIKEDESCYEAAIDLVNQGCKIIFANSFGHEDHMIRAAKENPDVIFCHATGYQAAQQKDMKNIFNYFTNIYEARYVSGIVAGMKLKQLMDEGTVTNPYVGYVGAYPYAEVISGYTAFFLGIRSIVPNAHMDVQYTNEWFNMTAESNTADILMSRGCVIIGQHADSTGAPSAVEAQLKKGTVAYSVGYNIDMLEAAPTAALTSATNNWGAYYTYAIKTAMEGGEMQQDWCGGYNEDAVAITKLGPNCAPGTAEAVEAAIAKIKSGELHVFDCSTFTVGGQTVTTTVGGDLDKDYHGVEYIKDGYFHESEFASAPAFYFIIDGITVLNNDK